MGIQVQIKLYAPFAGKLSKNSFFLSLNDCTVRAAVDYLLQSNPHLQGIIPALEKEDEFYREVLLLVGEKIVDLDSKLTDGNVLHLLPAIVSG